MSRGHDRERAVKRLLEDEDWWVSRAAGSLGDADLVALQDGKRPMLIEVKSTAGGPYERFGPKERAELSFAARLAGADALLCWWPSRGKVRWIAEHEWPNNNLKVVKMPRIQPYRDKVGKYRWRRIAENGNIIATDGGQGYENKRECLEMAEAQFPDDKLDWSLLPDPDALIDDGDDLEDEAEIPVAPDEHGLNVEHE